MGRSEHKEIHKLSMAISEKRETQVLSMGKSEFIKKHSI